MLTGNRLLMAPFVNITNRQESMEIPILTDWIFGSLKDQILGHFYEPGQRLNVMRIAESFGTSRSPVREALQRLAYEGLIKLIPRQGAFIKTIHLPEIKELFELREALEILAVRVSIIRAQQEQLDVLKKNLEKTEEILKNSQIVENPHKQHPIYPWDIDFHKQIFQMTFNPKLEAMGLELCSKLQLVRSRSGSEGERAFEALREHEEIYTALRDRNPHRAEKATRRHMQNALKNLIRLAPALRQK